MRLRWIVAPAVLGLALVTAANAASFFEDTLLGHLKHHQPPAHVAVLATTAALPNSFAALATACKTKAGCPGWTGWSAEADWPQDIAANAPFASGNGTVATKVRPIADDAVADYFVAMFETLLAKTNEAIGTANYKFSQWDFYHGHYFYNAAKSEAGVLFHLKEECKLGEGKPQGMLGCGTRTNSTRPPLSDSTCNLDDANQAGTILYKNYRNAIWIQSTRKLHALKTDEIGSTNPLVALDDNTYLPTGLVGEGGADYGQFAVDTYCRRVTGEQLGLATFDLNYFPAGLAATATAAQKRARLVASIY